MSTPVLSGASNKSQAHRIAKDLYCQQRNRLLAIAIRNSMNKEDAEEALQDSFALFINHFDTSSNAPPLAWLTLTLKRRCWALYHRQVNSPFIIQPKGEDGEKDQEITSPHTNHRTPEDVLVLTDQVRHIRKSITGLKPAERRAITYQALGYSYKEIAQHTGWTYTKVNRCITEGRARLREGHHNH